MFNVSAATLAASGRVCSANFTVPLMKERPRRLSEVFPFPWYGYTREFHSASLGRVLDSMRRSYISVIRVNTPQEGCKRKCCAKVSSAILLHDMACHKMAHGLIVRKIDARRMWRILRRTSIRYSLGVEGGCIEICRKGRVPLARPFWWLLPTAVPTAHFVTAT